MRVGTVFPQTEIGADPGGIRAYAQAIEDAGYRHVLTYDHVLGADPAVHSPWTGPYSSHDMFHEPMVLFGFLAGISTLEVVSGVVILPQRQTALLAKQAAEVDVLSGGRLRLGVGLGWNEVEYRALGQDFHTRGRRVEEQIALLRRLWTEPTVHFSGDQHTVDGAGINPLPVQRPIPIWIGARDVNRALKRVGRVADGWMPQARTGDDLEAAKEVVFGAAREAGRDPATIGMEGRVEYGDGDLDRIGSQAEAWLEGGATHLSINTMRAGLTGPDEHVAALRRAMGVVPAG